MNVNGARVFLDESDVEEMVVSYLEKMDDHPAFNTDEIRVMPDTHPEPNSQTLIGFTMPLENRVIPNVVGNDIGCGISTVCIGNEFPINQDEFEELDTDVRNRVPMGRGKSGYSSPDREYINLKDRFNWEKATNKLAHFVEENNLKGTELAGFEYDISYFKSLCKRVGYGMTDGINGVGTLGGGNHFIEISKSKETGEYYIVCHSGSRGLGKSVADYWQEKATSYREANRIKNEIPEEYEEYVKFNLKNVSDKELIEWVTGGVGEDFVDYEKLKNEFKNENPEKIEEISSILKQSVPEGGIGDSWDYLEGEEAYGYYRDMIFCQMYASLNRYEILNQVANIIGVNISEDDIIDSPHNIVDFEDSIIRKGATAARTGQKAVIPYNMRDGAIIVKGKGNDEWNQSCPHGAGRVGSRGDARSQITEEEASDVMKGVYTSEIPLDEAPHAYKNRDLIEKQITDTVEIVDEIRPVINFKAA